ncbi:hypothetical protein NDU88_009001 [Pleurodeles waltl]|uniref:Uncharacterized protein n=1 Tax=Pleurodeles waltl TaxID=8319 RepID=A0AAV7QRE7_PLEWA|nr:hypothetical protein NDU88_009001 [Pleurodeles waltl]
MQCTSARAINAYASTVQAKQNNYLRLLPNLSIFADCLRLRRHALSVQCTICHRTAVPELQYVALQERADCV